MFPGLSTALDWMKISRPKPNEDATTKPVYTPLPSVASDLKSFGTPNSSVIPRELIRLLRILPGSAPSIVECELQVVRLDKAPPYEALSYVWGNPNPSDFVICNGQRKAVTTNLGIALRHLRRQDEARLVWIDALCINQDDVDERSSQIKLMRDIYTKTWRVVVWLGEDPDDKADAAVRLLEMVAEDCCQELQLPMDRIGLNELLGKSANILSYGKYGSATMSSSMAVAVEKGIDPAAWLCSHSWFERIWVIQEVSFAPATIHIGTHEIAWKTAAVGAMWFNLKIQSANSDHRKAFAQVKDLFLVEDLVGGSYIHLLQRVAPFKATDPRDKLFAILGLSRDSDRFHPDFQPDYSKDVCEVYTSFARRMAVSPSDKYRNALAELYWTDWDPYTAADERIPTWVPRWDRRDVKEGQFMPLLNWKVSHGTGAAVETEFNPRILSLRGFRTAPTRLVHHGLHKESGNINVIKRIWDSVNNCIKDGDLPTLDVNDFDECFTRTITAGCNFDSSGKVSLSDGLWGAKELHNYLKCMKLRMSGQHESIQPENKRLAELLYAFAAKKTFFILEDGQMGMGPNATELGDIPCVFYGHKVPYMLRPTEDGKFLFIGPCYVHGIMYGEVMELLKAGKYREEWLQLC